MIYLYLYAILDQIAALRAKLPIPELNEKSGECLQATPFLFYSTSEIKTRL